LAPHWEKSDAELVTDAMIGFHFTRVGGGHSHEDAVMAIMRLDPLGFSQASGRIMTRRVLTMFRGRLSSALDEYLILSYSF
jgi:hypothetical protein